MNRIDMLKASAEDVGLPLRQLNGDAFVIGLDLYGDSLPIVRYVWTGLELETMSDDAFRDSLRRLWRICAICLVDIPRHCYDEHCVHSHGMEILVVTAAALH